MKTCLHKAVRRTIEDCIVCQEPISQTELVVWCKDGCGQNFHEECISRWHRRLRRLNAGQPHCVYCQTAWTDHPTCPCDNTTALMKALAAYRGVYNALLHAFDVASRGTLAVLQYLSDVHFAINNASIAIMEPTAKFTTPKPWILSIIVLTHVFCTALIMVIWTLGRVMIGVCVPETYSAYACAAWLVPVGFVMGACIIWTTWLFGYCCLTPTEVFFDEEGPFGHGGVQEEDFHGAHFENDGLEQDDFEQGVLEEEEFENGGFEEGELEALQQMLQFR